MSLKLATGGKNPVGIPDDIALSDEFSYGGVVATNYTYCNAVPLGGYTPGQKIVLNLPQEMISLRDAYLEFQITASAGNTASIVPAFVPDIRSIFSRMTVIFGSKTILDISEWGVLQNIFNLTNDVLWYNQNGRVLVASNTSASERQAYFADPNKVYSCRLNFSSGINSLFNKVLPLQKVGSQMQINLYLYQDASRVISANVAVTGTVAPSYVVNNVQLHYYTLVPTANWNKMFDQKISNNNFGGGVTFSYRGYDYTSDTTLMVAGSTGGSKTLTYKYASLLGFIVAFQPSSILNNWQDARKMNYFFNPAVNLLRVRVGGQQYPQDSSASDSDVFGRFLLMFGVSSQKPIAAASGPSSLVDTWSYQGSTPTAATYVPTCPLSKHPNEIRNDNRNVITGLDTSIATSIQLDIGTSVAVPTNLLMHIWAYYEATITLNPNGSVTLNN